MGITVVSCIRIEFEERRLSLLREQRKHYCIVGVTMEELTTRRHTLSKLFQLRTGHGALGSYFEKRFIAERSHYCECGQLETVERILRHSTERSCLRKVSPELDLQVLLDTKKGLGAVVKFLDSLL
jgi:hypothetical protein